MIAQQHFSPLAYFKRVLLPNMPQLINVTGTIFRVKEASKQFFVRFDNGAHIPIECGLGIGFNPPDFFKTVEITNENAENLTVEFYVGSADVIDSRLNSRFDRDNPITTKEAYSFATGQTVTMVPTATLATGYFGSDGRQRKQLIVSNNGPSELDVFLMAQDPATLVWAATATKVAHIWANSAWTVFTSAPLQLKNIGGSNNIVSILEIYYP